jgi:hypothetical protein
MLSVILHDADGVEVLLDQEMDVLEHFRRPTDRKSGAEGDGCERTGTERAKNAMALCAPPHLCGARRQGIHEVLSLHSPSYFAENKYAIRLAGLKTRWGVSLCHELQA